MKTRILTLTVLLLSAGLATGQSETIVELQTETGTLEGTLLFPAENPAPPVALIIAGSGPTDRDGNNPGMQNNVLKMMAVALQENGLATLRYDKRGIGKSGPAAIAEKDLRFENLISDVKGWIALLAEDERFDRIIVIGHSQGSLLGMVGAQEGNVDMFISIAGAGQTVDLALREQLAAQPPEILKMASPIIDELVLGNTVSDVPPMLLSLFRPDLQPYLISYMKFDPRVEIAKLSIPVLIIQGSTDIQVSEKDARMLAEANPGAEIFIIQGMNHVLRKAEPDRWTNLQTYSQPDLPIMQEVVSEIVDFVEKEPQTDD